MKKIIILFTVIVALTSYSRVDKDDNTGVAHLSVNNTSISTAEPVIEITKEPTETTQPTETAPPTLVPETTATPVIIIDEVTENSATPMPTVQVTPIPSATAVIVIPDIEVTEKPTKQPTFTPAPIEIPTPSPSPTLKPTKAPEYTVISSQIRSGALEGINEAREEEGHSPASLSNSLNAKAEAHAIEMAKSNSLYHSSMGYVESVRSGAFIDGWAEGYGAANHATGLCLDADIVNIGVGCAKSADGTVYTCIIGSR